MRHCSVGVTTCPRWEISRGRTYSTFRTIWMPWPRDEGLPREELDERLRASRETLKSQRASREAPLRDEKILASWNALTLRVLAEVGAALDEPRYLAAARAGASWLTKVLRPDGMLLHQVTLGEARIPGFLDDVAGSGTRFSACMRLPWTRAGSERPSTWMRRWRRGFGILRVVFSSIHRLMGRPSSSGPVRSRTARHPRVRRWRRSCGFASGTCSTTKTD